ncbi:MAG: type IV pilus modification protein PilV [Xanthomonadales bacterium]|nr:type IV pilus modification protein PilV [Xanthomonadales bacterium]
MTTMTTPGLNQKASGFSLLEVLIAVLVLSVGLLGLAALQNVSVANTQGANHHTLATTIAYGALDEVRIELDRNTNANLKQVAENYCQAARFKSQFPNEEDYSCGAVAGGGELTVTVSWKDERLGEEGKSRANAVTARSKFK